MISNFFIRRRNRCHLGNLVFGFSNAYCHTFDSSNSCSDTFFDTFFERHWIRACGHISHTFSDHCPRKYCCGCCSVSSNIISFFCNFFNKFRTDSFDWIFEFYFLCDRDTIIGDRRCAPLFVQHNITAFRTERHSYCVSKLIHACFKGTTGFLVE